MTAENNFGIKNKWKYAGHHIAQERAKSAAFTGGIYEQRPADADPDYKNDTLNEYRHYRSSALRAREMHRAAQELSTNVGVQTVEAMEKAQALPTRQERYAAQPETNALHMLMQSAITNAQTLEMAHPPILHNALQARHFAMPYIEQETNNDRS